MKAETFDKFWRTEKKHLVRLLKALKKDIDDDCRASEEDTTPGMQITISVSADCDTWSYQTGDNSFTGSCYGDPHWGTGYLCRRSNTKSLAAEMIDDLASTIEFE